MNKQVCKENSILKDGFQPNLFADMQVSYGRVFVVVVVFLWTVIQL